MALVLRKAVLPRNVTLLKCIKGRPLATTANKKNAAPLSKAVLGRSAKEERAMALGYVKIAKSRPLSTLRRITGPTKTPSLRFSVSCPNLVPETRTRPNLPIRHLSPPRTKPVFSDSSYPKNHSRSPFSLASSLLQSNFSLAMPKRLYSKPCACGCPCPWPCGPCGNACGCNCLPPPCNTPPRCIQYMTGYYYYPYGFWFCGPYHVSGTCTPVGPCGSCGPCAPCPAPCGKCCAPCCVCPATAAVMGTQDPKERIKTGVVPSNQIKYPLSQENAKQNRAGISKYFPFNSAMSPGPIPNVNNMEPKKPNPPMMSSLICPFCTKAEPGKLPEQYEPDKFYSPIDVIHNKYATSNCSPCPNSFGKSVKNHSPTAKISSITNTKYSEDYKLKGCRSPIRHKRSKRYIYEVCPQVDQPMNPRMVERDDSKVTSAFDYTLPRYRFSQPKVDTEFKPYENQF